MSLNLCCVQLGFDSQLKVLSIESSLQFKGNVGSSFLEVLQRACTGHSEFSHLALSGDPLPL